ncbi:MAG TPA: YbaK/EbsC family protein [Anaerolineales bacterium]|nr:YbaK/EbsC family protein [Anaerolineales bacterium]
MSQSLSFSAQKVQDALNQFGLSLCVVELPASTRTAVDAATAVGCSVGQIAKSLIFTTKQSEKPVLVIASGTNRVNEKRIGELLGEPIRKADADFVREHTGFVIGGVPPVGHTTPLATFIDEDLLQYRVIWAAAGTPNAVFELTPGDLVKIAGGRTVALK